MMMMTRELSFPRSIFHIYWFVSIIAISGIRHIAHWIIYDFPIDIKSKTSVAIYGAGEAGVKLAESIQNSSLYILEALFDDDDKKNGTIINSKKVYSPALFQEVIDKKKLGLIKSISAYGSTALLTSTSHLIDLFILGSFQ